MQSPTVQVGALLDPIREARRPDGEHAAALVGHDRFRDIAEQAAEIGGVGPLRPDTGGEDRHTRQCDVAEAEGVVDGAATPHEALDMNERLRLCQQALEVMPTLRREIFVRRRVHEEPYEVIARDLKLSVETVQKHYSRAAQTLRKTAEARHGD